MEILNNIRWYVVTLPFLFDERELRLETTVDSDCDLYLKYILYMIIDDAINDNVADTDLHSAMAIFSSFVSVVAIMVDNGWWRRKTETKSERKCWNLSH